MNKKVFIGIVIALCIVVCIVCVYYLFNHEKKYDIRITIPAGSTETYVYSHEEFSPKKSKITIRSSEGLDDTEVILKPIEWKKEIPYEPTYLTRGIPVKMEVEKGAWFKIGVNIQNTTNEDIDVYVNVTDVHVRIE